MFSDYVVGVLVGITLLLITGWFAQWKRSNRKQRIRPHSPPRKKPILHPNVQNSKRHLGSTEETLLLDLNPSQFSDLQNFINRDIITTKTLSLDSVSYELKTASSNESGKATFHITPQLFKSAFKIHLTGLIFEDLIFLETEKFTISTKQFSLNNSNQHVPILFHFELDLLNAKAKMNLRFNVDTFPVTTLERWLAFLNLLTEGNSLELHSTTDQNFIVKLNNLRAKQFIPREDLKVFMTAFSRLKELKQNGFIKSDFIDMNKMTAIAINRIRMLHDIFTNGHTEISGFSLDGDYKRLVLLKLIMLPRRLTKLHWEFPQYVETFELPNGESFTVNTASMDIEFAIITNLWQSIRQIFNPTKRTIPISIAPKPGSRAIFRARITKHP